MTMRTRNNLLAAMRIDALDGAKYHRFAARARMDEDWSLARAFHETAQADECNHFAKEAELEGVVADSAENLRRAIQSEQAGIKTFERFAEEARHDHDLTAAALFEEIIRDKAEHCTGFEALLSEMGVHSEPQTV